MPLISTPMHMHMFLALMNLKVVGEFSTRINFVHEDKGHSLKVERSLFLLNISEDAILS